MYTLTQEFRFEAAHSLPHLPPDHKCHRLHGHSYRVVLVLEADWLDERGFAGGVEYGELRAFAEIIDALDHRNLNDVLPVPATTAEHLARYLYEQAARFWQGSVAAVRVHETAPTCVEYRP